jgi:phage shock protein C
MDKMNRKLTRSASNRMVCGVCAGVGEYFQVDPTVIRLLWAILTFCGVGSGILVYIIAAVIMPEG